MTNVQPINWPRTKYWITSNVMFILFVISYDFSTSSKTILY